LGLAFGIGNGVSDEAEGLEKALIKTANSARASPGIGSTIAILPSL
jgi:hypothetical protein